MEGTNTNVVATPVVQTATEAPKKTFGQKVSEFINKPLVKGLIGTAAAVGAGGAAGAVAGHMSGKKAGYEAGCVAAYDVSALESARADKADEV